MRGTGDGDPRGTPRRSPRKSTGPGRGSGGRDAETPAWSPGISAYTRFPEHQEPETSCRDPPWCIPRGSTHPLHSGPLTAAWGTLLPASPPPRGAGSTVQTGCVGGVSKASAAPPRGHRRGQVLLTFRVPDSNGGPSESCPALQPREPATPARHTSRDGRHPDSLP